jgi:hypothetical protein
MKMAAAISCDNNGQVFPTSWPLYTLLNEINRAASGGMPLLAISMTVALPDLCCSLVSADGRSTGELYRAWCDENLGPKFSYVTGDDLWSMRCGVLHSGRFGDLKHNVERIVFALPGGPLIVTNCIMNKAYIYNVDEFCMNFTNAVFNWHEKNREDPVLRANAQRMMQYRRDFPPYVRNIDVLA